MNPEDTSILLLMGAALLILLKQKDTVGVAPVITSRYQDLKRPVNVQRLFDPQRRITPNYALAYQKKRCNDSDGTWFEGKCHYRISAANKRAVCVKKAQDYYASQERISIERLKHNAISLSNVNSQIKIIKRYYRQKIQIMEDSCRRKAGLKEPTRMDKFGNLTNSQSENRPAQRFDSSLGGEFAV